jgi:hypothetical protein
MKEIYEKDRIVLLILPETHIQTLHTNFCTSLRRREELCSSDPRHAKKRVSLENPLEFAKRNCLFLSIIMKDVYMCGKVEYIILYHDKKRTGTIFVPA